MDLRKLITEIKDILYSVNEYLVHLYEMAQPEGKVRDRSEITIEDMEQILQKYILVKDKQ